MNKDITNYSKTIFDSIKHIDENGKEYWEARELMKILEYTNWRNFEILINRSMKTVKNNNLNVNYHFDAVIKMIEIAKGAKRKVKDYKLSRYACYLIAMNGDPRKKVIADAQNYFAVQTRKQEITEEEYERLVEENKRLFRRRKTKEENKLLYAIARVKGVKKLDEFTNSGYRGLYDGEDANAIFKRKKLNYREDILDNMGSEELGANIFRISQTEAQLRKQNNISEEDANTIHYDIGKNVRDAIIKNGNLPPEKLPTPSKSIKEIEKERKDGEIPELKDYMTEKEIMIEESLKENIEKNKTYEIARKMLEKKIDIGLIEEVIDLSKEEIDALIK